MATKNIIGIYKITNPNGKIYIGQSRNILSRWNEYNKLHCKKQIALYNSLLKYGFNNHKFDILHECEIDELNILEKYYVDLFSTFNNQNGLNIKDGGGFRANISEETKKKISISSKNRVMSQETKDKISKSNLGRKMSDDAKKKMVKSRLGIKLTDEHKQKISNSNKGNKNLLGHKQSKETIEKRVSKTKGLKRSQEVKDKISKIHKGKKLTEEHKKKLSISHSNISIDAKLLYSIAHRDSKYNNLILIKKDLNNNQLEVFADIYFATKSINCKIERLYGHILRNKNTNKPYKGYLWEVKHHVD